MFNFKKLLSKKTREELQNNKASSILHSIETDLNRFTHEEEANILLIVLRRFKERKRLERKRLLDERDRINIALRQLK